MNPTSALLLENWGINSQVNMIRQKFKHLSKR